MNELRFMVSLLDYYAGRKPFKVAARRAGVDATTLESFAQKLLLPYPTKRSPETIDRLLELLKTEGLDRETLEKAYLKGGFGAVAKKAGLPIGCCKVLFRHWGIKWRKPVKPWTTEEEQIIVQNYQKMTVRELLTLLPNRTRSAIITKMSALRGQGKIEKKRVGLRKINNEEFARLWNEGKSGPEIAEIFHVETSYVYLKRKLLELPARGKLFSQPSPKPVSSAELDALKKAWANGLAFSEIEKITGIPKARVNHITRHRWDLAVTVRINSLVDSLWLPTELYSLAVSIAKSLWPALKKAKADQDLTGYRLVAPLAVWIASIKLQYPLGLKRLAYFCPEFQRYLFRFSRFVPFERANPNYPRWLAYLLTFPKFHQLGFQDENWKEVVEGCDQLFKKIEREGDRGLFLHTDPFQLVTAAVIMFGRESIERRNPARIRQIRAFERTLCKEFKPEERHILYPLIKKIKWFMATSTIEKEQPLTR